MKPATGGFFFAHALGGDGRSNALLLAHNATSVGKSQRLPD
ncbi:hypothetical protein [Chitinasiproducens palmae]|nr:hypothetical protein [Chitinasiproducens palmae]